MSTFWWLRAQQTFGGTRNDGDNRTTFIIIIQAL
jgi:hypothetical protein